MMLKKILLCRTFYLCVLLIELSLLFFSSSSPSSSLLNCFSFCHAIAFLPGFGKGYIRWDDENSESNNKYYGSLPDGKYGDNTLIQYCCRADGHATNPIMLPTDQPFVLFKANTHQCQEVQGMHAREEWFKWDTEDWSFSGNKKAGMTPYGEVGRNIKLDYCYYTKIR